jgi:hypothetical protein
MKVLPFKSTVEAILSASLFFVVAYISRNAKLSIPLPLVLICCKQASKL